MPFAAVAIHDRSIGRAPDSQRCRPSRTAPPRGIEFEGEIDLGASRGSPDAIAAVMTETVAKMRSIWLTAPLCRILRSTTGLS